MSLETLITILAVAWTVHEVWRAASLRREERRRKREQEFEAAEAAMLHSMMALHEEVTREIQRKREKWLAAAEDERKFKAAIEAAGEEWLQQHPDVRCVHDAATVDAFLRDDLAHPWRRR